MRKSGHAGIERKALVGGECKVLSEDEGIVEAIVSVTGIVDEVDDVIVPGAYAKTLVKRRPKGVDAHDWEQPVSKALEVVELMPGDTRLPATTSRGEPWPREAGALLVKMQFNLDTQRGRETFANVKFFGAEQEWSIGYKVPRGGSRTDQRKGIRYIDTLDLFEFSPVLFGAMPLAGSVGVKGLTMTDFEEKALPGSFEERRDLIERAVTDLLLPVEGDGERHGWIYMRGTFADRVVVSQYQRGIENTVEWEIPYTLGEDGQVVLGEPTPVKVVESVVPDEGREPTPGTAPDADATEAKAPGEAFLSPVEILTSESLRAFT